MAIRVRAVSTLRRSQVVPGRARPGAGARPAPWPRGSPAASATDPAAWGGHPLCAGDGRLSAGGDGAQLAGAILWPPSRSPVDEQDLHRSRRGARPAGCRASPDSWDRPPRKTGPSTATVVWPGARRSRASPGCGVAPVLRWPSDRPSLRPIRGPRGGGTARPGRTAPRRSPGGPGGRESCSLRPLGQLHRLGPIAMEAGGSRPGGRGTGRGRRRARAGPRTTGSPRAAVHSWARRRSKIIRARVDHGAVDEARRRAATPPRRSRRPSPRRASPTPSVRPTHHDQAPAHSRAGRGRRDRGSPHACDPAGRGLRGGRCAATGSPEKSASSPPAHVEVAGFDRDALFGFEGGVGLR